MKINVAVFGHYDSRGGTTAIPIPEFTMDAVYKAMRRYDTEVFCIDPNDPAYDIGTTSYGMPAREADKIAHKLIYGNDLPSHQDCMFVAELEVDTAEPRDLEESGVVLCDNNGGQYHYRITHNTITGEPYDPIIEGDAPGSDNYTSDYLEASIEKPVRLRYIPYPADLTKDSDDRPERIEEWEKELQEQVKAEWDVRRWDDDAYGFMLMD